MDDSSLLNFVDAITRQCDTDVTASATHGLFCSFDDPTTHLGGSSRVAFCDCQDGPLEVLDPSSNLRNCGRCGKVLSTVAVDNDTTTSMRYRADAERYSSASSRGDALGTRITGYGYLKTVNHWVGDKSGRPLRKKLDFIRQTCSHFIPAMPRNVIREACRLFETLDQYMQEIDEIHRAGRLVGMEAACVKHAIDKCRWLCTDDQIMRHFFMKLTRTKRTGEDDSIVIERTRQYLTYGMTLLLNALQAQKTQMSLNDLPLRDTGRPKTTAEIRLANVQSFIRLGCATLKSGDMLMNVALHLAVRLNRMCVVQSRQDETIYITCIVMANERHPIGRKVTTSQIIEALGSTSSTVTKLKNDTRAYLEKVKFKLQMKHIKRSRRQKCVSTDPVFDSVFPTDVDILLWNKS